jgi:hypothetical protein
LKTLLGAGIVFCEEENYENYILTTFKTDDSAKSWKMVPLAQMSQFLIFVDSLSIVKFSS